SRRGAWPPPCRACASGGCRSSPWSSPWSFLLDPVHDPKAPRRVHGVAHPVLGQAREHELGGGLEHPARPAAHFRLRPPVPLAAPDLLCPWPAAPLKSDLAPAAIFCPFSSASSRLRVTPSAPWAPLYWTRITPNLTTLGASAGSAGGGVPSRRVAPASDPSPK